MKIVLETDRLYLRELTDSDTKHIHKLHNDPDVMKYISSKKDTEITFEECSNFILKCKKYYTEHPGMGIWATVIKENDDFIGWTTIKDLDNTNIIEIGYRYLKKYWGKGYATEASKALTGYGFNTLNLSSIAAVAMQKNKASARVMQKIGMKYIGIKNFYNTEVVYYQIDKI